jgi:hypothetical protein
MVVMDIMGIVNIMAVMDIMGIVDIMNIIRKICILGNHPLSRNRDEFPRRKVSIFSKTAWIF